MNTKLLSRAIPRLRPPKCLHHPYSTAPTTPSSPQTTTPGSQPTTAAPPTTTTTTPGSPRTTTARPPAPLPSNISRYAARQPNRSAGIALAQSLMKNIDRTKYTAVRDYDASRAALNDATTLHRARSLERRMPRNGKWASGDVYAPHDLSAVEAQKWNKRKSSERDVFDILGINPLHEYKNISIMSEYMTPLGRIKSRLETGLRAVNQRKIAKAIRRAVGMGLVPSVHEHPEVLEVKARERALRLENGMGGRR